MAAETVKRVASLASAAFEKYQKELHRFLVRRLRDRQDAADLAQEVYLRLVRVENSEWVRKPQAYVYGVASHVVSEFRMRSEKDWVTFDSEAVERLADHPAHLPPDELAEQLGLERQLEEVLGELPPTHLAVLLLHKRDGLSYEAVAEQLGISVHTVQKYLYQAKTRVRARWKQMDKEDAR